MTKETKVDVLRVTVGNFLLAFVMVLIFALVGHFSLEVIWGAILGAGFVSLSFWWLAVSVTKYVEKDPKTAQAKVSATYTVRLLLVAVMIIVAIKVPFFNFVAAIIPLFYQRLVIMVVGKMRSNESKREVSADEH